MSTAALVDRLLHACGGGRVLCIGRDPSAIVAAFRRRAVDAQAWVPPSADALLRLDRPDASVDLVHLDDGGLPDDTATRDVTVQELLRVAGRAVSVRARQGSRDALERTWLTQACRKHPRSQIVVPYNELEWHRTGAQLLIEPLPAGAQAGGDAADLAAGRDLHMDMLREAGRRSDAHVARYMFACQFVRPGDRVLDAACGLGYGAAILTDSTLAESVLGIDLDPWAIGYADRHYGLQRSRLSFRAMDVMDVRTVAPESLDIVVSFETLEHVDDPEAFLAACRRALTPGGRIIGSIPNMWVGDDGHDPNPHHVQVFDRSKLEALCRRHFLIEHTYGQTAGGGMKMPDAPRQIWEANPSSVDAEWWLAVGMKDPFGPGAGPVRDRLVPCVPGDPSNIYAFDRDYANPWLARALVIIGLRATSDPLLQHLVRQTVASTAPESADMGAALCVQAYRHLEQDEPVPAALTASITLYVTTPATVAHVRRWQISLRYVLALAAMRQEQPAAAVPHLEACARADALAFSPHLATKTVGAAFLLGWTTLQSGDADAARRWWTVGIDQAERALHRPWGEFMLSRERPALFGLREATAIVDLASQCASGLALLEHAPERPGVVASQLFECLQERARTTTAAGAGATAARTNAATGAVTTWSVLQHLAELTQHDGKAGQVAHWDVAIGGETSAALLLHPPAAVTIRIPTARAGRISTAVALHPDVWERPGVSTCVFTLAADEVVTAAIALDPHANPGDRRWVEISLDVPASRSGFHQLTLSTQGPHGVTFNWALFRDVVFEPDR